MPKAKIGDTVEVSYIGTFQNGDVFDQSTDGETLQFTIGENEMIPGFENAVIGMETGETKSVTLDSASAYGERNDDAVVTVTRSRLPDNLDPAVGMRLQVQDENGSPVIVTITEITNATVTLDANHPLAGKDLNFEITLKEIK